MNITNQDAADATSIGRSHGVDGRLLVAIGIVETRWGTLGDGRPPPAGHAHILGVESYDSGSSSSAQGLLAQLNEGAATLAANSVTSIGDIKAGRLHCWQDQAGTWHTRWASADRPAHVAPNDSGIDYPWTAGVIAVYDQILSGAIRPGDGPSTAWRVPIPHPHTPHPVPADIPNPAWLPGTGWVRGPFPKAGWKPSTGWVHAPFTGALWQPDGSWAHA